MKRNIAFLILLILGVCSCKYKPLCYIHDEHSLGYDAQVIAEYEQDWEYQWGEGRDWAATWPEQEFGFKYDDLRPQIPGGLRSVVYFPKRRPFISNLAPNGGVVHLAQGPHDIIFHNNDAEYIVFDELETFASARATTRTKTRASYFGSPYSETGEAELTVAPPDMLYGHFFEQYEMERSVEPAPMPVVMRPLVFTYYIRIKITHGRDYVALARGALSGMAADVYLNSGATSPSSATLLFDASLTDFGAQAFVLSFGVPNFPNPNYTKANAHYGLNIELRLRNGKILKYDRDVSDQVSSQPRGGVIEVSDIVVPDEEGLEQSSGFIVDVTDWDEFEDIYVDF